MNDPKFLLAKSMGPKDVDELLDFAADALAVLSDVKTWCEMNRREGSVIYPRVCAVLDRLERKEVAK